MPRLLHFISLGIICICGAFITKISAEWTGTLGEWIFFGIISVILIITVCWSDDILIESGGKTR